MPQMSYEEANDCIKNLIIKENFAEALLVVQQLISQLPKDANFRMLEAKALLALGRYRDAADSLFLAVELDPNNTEYRCMLSIAHLRIGDIQLGFTIITEAMAKYITDLRVGVYYMYILGCHDNILLECIWSKHETQRLVEFMIETHINNPLNYELFASISAILTKIGRFDRAERFFAYCLKDINLETSAATASSISLEYSHSAIFYDNNLLHLISLQEFIAVVRPHLEGRSGLVIVDAVCGTGAAGPYLRPHASSLIGVDISNAMLDIARGKGLYDRLIVDDMIGSMADLSDVDLIICHGATYYLNDLTDFFAATSRSLQSGGQLIFNDFPAPPGSGTMITKGGNQRFCRSEDMIRRLAAEVGLREISSVTISTYKLPCRCWVFQRD